MPLALGRRVIRGDDAAPAGSPLVAALPTAITWGLEFAGVAGFSNAVRFIAALPLGFAAALAQSLGVLG